MDNSHASHGSDRPLLVAIALILGLYILYILGMQVGWLPAPKAHEAETAQAVAGDTESPVETAPEETSPEDAQASTPETEDHAEPEHEAAAETHGEEAAESDHAESDHAKADHAELHEPPPFLMVIPFVLLLGAIAILPLIPATEHWWEHNLNRFIVAAVLGAITLAYYLLFHTDAVACHWLGHSTVAANQGGPNFGIVGAMFANGILNEYIPFIMLLFSLYTICGGIRIQGDLPAHSLTNSGFIAVGGLLASFIGTTGAAMLLIRPLLETNRERHNVKHTVIFFIFVVCNCGGCLLPIGDPPLFLGYLRGVNFLWTFNLWPAWLFVNLALISIYFVLDHFFYYPKEKPIDIVRDETSVRALKFSGLWPNVPLLFGVVFSVALLDPGKALPGTTWHPWPYLREIVQLGLVGVSLVLGSQTVRKANNFNYHAILEVAALFFGIFLCMQPPLQILNVRGPELGLSTPMQFFWATGSLSSVLDNAPTYVVFFETAKTLKTAPGVVTEAGVAVEILTAIALGAVFMGAMTYIGNGPNFMVRAIAEKSGVRMPSFFGYMLYSCAILLPLLVLTTCFMWIILPAIAS